MRKLLVINSSPRKSSSNSRKLSDLFVASWKEQAGAGSVTFRDLGETPVPPITEDWITGAFKPEQERSEEEHEALQLSTVLIRELKEADVIVIGAPMHNWSVTSLLKAYIDQVLRVNETWKLNPADRKHPYIGLLENKTLFLLLSQGGQGYEPGGYNEHMNFQSPYLKTVFNIVGIKDIHEVSVGGAAFDPEVFQQVLKDSGLKIGRLVEACV